jgi:hypothetical protein
MEYTLEDAFEKIKIALGDSYQIINIIFLSQQQKYEDIINSLNKKINKLNNQIERFKKENSKLKNTNIQLQDKLLSLSQMLSQLSKEDNDLQKKDIKYNSKKKNFFKNKTKVQEIHRNFLQNLNDIKTRDYKNNDRNDDNYINNEIYNINKQTIDIDLIKNTNKDQLINKNVNFKKEKTFTKGFNLSNNESTPKKIYDKGNKVLINENESQSSNSLKNNYNIQQSNTISNLNYRRNKYNKLVFEDNTINNDNDNNRKDIFNMIAKRIRHLKNGLSINNIENNNGINERNYTTYSLKRRNFSNV